ncbi:MAG: GAF domain-containing protein [Anaerolineales bacterium]|nr:GAF domain-containing protein [Anaerolineales bacterium]
MASTPTMPASLEGLRVALRAMQKRLAPEDSLQPLIAQTLSKLDSFHEEASRADEHSRLAAIFQVSQALGSSLVLDDALKEVMDAVIRLTGAERGCIMLFDEAAGRLDLRAARNLERESLSEKEMEYSRTVVETVSRTGKAVLTTNAQTDPRFSDQHSVMQFSLRSVLCVPLKVKDRILGVIYVDNRVRTGLFSERDRELLSAFAVQAAIAIENAQLYTLTDRALAARVAELEGLQRADRQLNATLETETVASALLDFALQITHAARGWVAIRPDEDSDPQIVAAGGYPENEQPALPPSGDPLGAAGSGGGVALRAAAPHLPAGMLAPIVREGNTVGLVLVERPERNFIDAERQALERLADHAAAAAENTRLFQRLRRANDAKSQFVSIVSHELKIPMTSIRGYADLLRQGLIGPVNEKQLEFLRTIMGNVDRMTALVSDLSDISRIETGRLRIEPAAVSAETAVRDVVIQMKPQFDARKQTVQTEFPAALPKIRTDPQRLAQILTNLLSNASKYSPEGGQILLRAVDEKTRVRIAVQDHGIGMTAEEQSRLFTQFFRGESSAVRDQPGWGLGLHVTKRLVEVLGGEIGVESIPGRGSTFSFTQPVEPST